MEELALLHSKEWGSSSEILQNLTYTTRRSQFVVSNEAEPGGLTDWRLLTGDYAIFE